MWVLPLAQMVYYNVPVDFEVTTKLPNITFALGRSFAGNLPVNRAGHPNNTLFFYGFEKSHGSLTVRSHSANGDPWGIWLNGGFVLYFQVTQILTVNRSPGSSSMFGLFFEVNGVVMSNAFMSSQA